MLLSGKVPQLEVLKIELQGASSCAAHTFNLSESLVALTESLQCHCDRFIAGSLEAANSSILAAQRLFKILMGKKSEFYDNSVSNQLISLPVTSFYNVIILQAST